jgi:hypothetical protein
VSRSSRKRDERFIKEYNKARKHFKAGSVSTEHLAIYLQDVRRLGARLPSEIGGRGLRTFIVRLYHEQIGFKEELAVATPPKRADRSRKATTVMRLPNTGSVFLPTGGGRRWWCHEHKA